jgi:adenylosuccinate synthase
MEAKIVLGLQFGDEGKGRTVDYLSKSPKRTIVVRFSGGQNCGHTVMRDDIKHVFSNYGSGSLSGVPTYISEHCTVYLNTIYAEQQSLITKGITPKLYVHPKAMLTTPYDVVLNRILSKINKHGSCGVGISTTMKRNLETGYKLYAQDLKHPKIFKVKLLKIKQYVMSMVDEETFYDELGLSEDNFFSLINENLFEIKDYDFLWSYDNLIFEGSQGIMLDMDHGIFPNVTYANTTSKNAIEICEKLNIRDIKTFYITRCYQTRHGNGWMSNTGDISLINNEEEINVPNFQGEFRVGELDYDIINYAYDVDRIYNKSKFNFLVVTCLDQRPEFKLDETKLKGEFNLIKTFNSPKNDNN